MKKKICFVSGTSPKFLGGISQYQNNLINYSKKLNKFIEFTWIYPGVANKEYLFENIKCIEIKSPKCPFLKEIIFGIRFSKKLKKENFDLINTHANWGYGLIFYKKQKYQKITQTYHGTGYYYLKSNLHRFNLLKKIFLLPALFLFYLIEKPPINRADKIICVSNKVKNEIVSLYGKNLKIEVIRTGVDINLFKPRNKDKEKSYLKLEKDRTYGLYIGGGGYWTKGLDRVINLSKEIHKLNKKFKLVIIGPDYKKVKHLLNEPFLIFLKNVPREKIPNYYSASDIFFCLSRYEGGAPTLVISEAMASGCLLVTSKDAKQEIIEDEKNGIIIGENYEKEAKRIMQIYENQSKKQKIIQNSLKTIKELSLEKWGKKYLNALLN